MLHQQLIPGVVLLMSVSAFAADDVATRAADMEKAQGEMVQSKRTSADTLEQATTMLNEGTHVKKEMEKIANVRPAKLGAIDGVHGQKPDIDFDALVAKYDQFNKVPSVEDGEQALVFISASVPMESLRLLARQASQVGATLVLRGPVNGDFDKTAEFMSQVLGDEKPLARAMIQPKLFTRFDVQQVPAFVVVPAGACTGSTRACPEDTPEYVHVAGDVSLYYALDYIARNHPKASAVSSALLARLGAE